MCCEPELFMTNFHRANNIVLCTLLLCTFDAQYDVDDDIEEKMPDSCKR